jgi:hypothetical protein
LVVNVSVAEEEAPPANWKEILQRLEQKIEAQEKRIEQLEKERGQPPASAVAAPTAPPPVTPLEPSWSPAQPIPLLRAGPAFVNISFDTLVDFGWSTDRRERLNLGGHDPAQRGFSLPNSEIVFDGAVDPYFKGVADIVMSLDEDGETTVELEENYLLTTSLPWNLQVKGGQFLTEFGRHNPQHPHQWAFVDQPLVINRMFGPDGLRNPGARVSWLAPTPWYSELFLAILNGRGETAWSFRNGESAEIHGGEPVERGLRGPQDLVFVPRVATSFDLSDTQTLLLGASAAFGPNNSGANSDSRVFGVDAYWKWRATAGQAGFPFVSFQAEAMYRRYEAAERTSIDDPLVTLPAETLRDWGFYAQALWGFRRGWVAGLRGEHVSADNAAFDSESRLDRARLSPNLTWYPSEFSKLRLQYNYDHGQAFGDEHSAWLQFEFLLGAHGAHRF